MSALEEAQRALDQAVICVAQAARSVSDIAVLTPEGYLVEEDAMDTLRDELKKWTKASNDFLAAVKATHGG